jgi:cell division septum initiation protein DivIVA
MSEVIAGYFGDKTIKSIQRLWLGYDGNYVAEISDDDYHYYLDDYNDLKKHIEDIEEEIYLGNITSEGPSIKVRKYTQSKHRSLTWLKANCYEY